MISYNVNKHVLIFFEDPLLPKKASTEDELYAVLMS